MRINSPTNSLIDKEINLYLKGLSLEGHLQLQPKQIKKPGGAPIPRNFNVRPGFSQERQHRGHFGLINIVHFNEDNVLITLRLK